MRTLIANIVAIYRKELQSYFASPLAYVIAGVFWLLAGFFFTVILMGPGGLIAQSAYRDQLGVTEPPLDVPYQFLGLFLGILGSLALFILPILSMGLYAEERKRGTLELLATSPVSIWVVSLGKLLGVVTFFASLVMPLMVYEAIALNGANPPIQPTVMLLGHAGLIVMAAAVLSLGMFISALTDSTILAAILTFGLVLLLWVVDAIAASVQGPLKEAIAHVSLIRHYTDLTQGILDTNSLILFGSYIFLGLFLTTQVIEALRFQRS